VLFLVAAHFGARRLAALSVLPWVRKQAAERQPPGDLITAFKHNTRSWRSALFGKPSGWNAWAEERVGKVLRDCEAYVQSLNERFTNPRGLQD
jgi:hypothetical protein